MTNSSVSFSRSATLPARLAMAAASSRLALAADEERADAACQRLPPGRRGRWGRECAVLLAYTSRLVTQLWDTTVRAVVGVLLGRRPGRFRCRRCCPSPASVASSAGRPFDGLGGGRACDGDGCKAGNQAKKQRARRAVTGRSTQDEATGRQRMAEIGRRWQRMADTGTHWQTLADTGRDWQRLADIGRHWQTLADIGRHWQTLAGAWAMNPFCRCCLDSAEPKAAKSRISTPIRLVRMVNEMAG